MDIIVTLNINGAVSTRTYSDATTSIDTAKNVLSIQTSGPKIIAQWDRSVVLGWEVATPN